ncbi:MAG: hypothetical protein LUD81_06250 [Clostridiales bacterium]|nr:hypothetical protein [Clostridiales bacterium]
MLFGGNKRKDLGEPYMIVYSTGKRIIGFQRDGMHTMSVEIKSDKELDAFCKKYKIEKSGIETMHIQLF